MLAQCYLIAGSYDKARTQFQTMLARDPNAPEIHFLLGEAYDAMDRENEAISEFRAAAAGRSQADAHFAFGYL